MKSTQAWIDFEMKPPTLVNREYWVTVHNSYWTPSVKVMRMTWEIEERGKTKRYVWKSDKVVIPKTWEVTHWILIVIPEPAWKE